MASGSVSSYLDLGRAPYCYGLYGVKYIDLVSLAPFPGIWDEFIIQQLPRIVTWGLSLLYTLRLSKKMNSDLYADAGATLGHDLRYVAATVSHTFLAFGELLELYKRFLELLGYSSRVLELDSALQATHQMETQLKAASQLQDSDGDSIQFKGLDVVTPTGTKLVSNLTLEVNQRKIFQNGVKSGFKMCFGPSTLGAGGQNTSRIQNKEVYTTLYLQVKPKENLLVTGCSGSGKTSIVRTLGDLWHVEYTFHHHAPFFFQNGLQAKSGFEMCFDIESQHLGCWGQNTSRIQNKEVYATLCLQARARGHRLEAQGQA